MKKNILAIIGLISIFTTFPAYSADVGIGAFLQRLVYPAEQSIEFYITGFNIKANAENVDVHIGLITADGTIYEYPDWNTNFTPWLSSFSLPANFELPVTLVDSFDNFPGGLEPGAYQLAVALTSPGTLNLLSFNTQSFKIISSVNDLTIGGVGIGHGQSANGLIPPTANASGAFVRLNTNEIAQQQIVDEQIVLDIDQCKFHKTATLLGSNLDAGETLILGSEASGNITLNKQSFNGRISYGVTPNPPESFYIADETYTLQGAGSDDISDFRISAIAPGEIIITDPDLSTLESLDSSQDLTLRWQGNHGVGEIELVLQLGIEQNSYEINCRLVDDGEAVISSNLLVQLRDAVPANSSPVPDFPGINLPELLEDPMVNFAISRNRIEFINDDDEDTTLFIISWTLGGAFKIS